MGRPAVCLSINVILMIRFKETMSWTHAEQILSEACRRWCKKHLSLGCNGIATHEVKSKDLLLYKYFLSPIGSGWAASNTAVQDSITRPLSQNRITEKRAETMISLVTHLKWIYINVGKICHEIDSFWKYHIQAYFCHLNWFLLVIWYHDLQLSLVANLPQTRIPADFLTNFVPWSPFQTSMTWVIWVKGVNHSDFQSAEFKKSILYSGQIEHGNNSCVKVWEKIPLSSSHDPNAKWPHWVAL